MTPTASRHGLWPVWMYAIVIGALALAAGAVCLMPCGDDVRFYLLLVATGALTAGAYRLMPWRNRAGWIALIIFWTMLAIGVTANLHQWTAERWCTPEHPWMLNPDANDFRNQALIRAGLVPERPIYDLNYAVTYDGILFGFAWLFGRSIIYPMIGNMLMTLLSLVMTGWLAVRLLASESRHSASFIASAAIIMVGAIASYLNCGTVLIKDATLNCCTVAGLLGLTGIWNPPAKRYRMTAMMAVALIGLAGITIVRYQMLFMLLPAAMLTYRKRNAVAVLSAVACILILYFAIRTSVTTYEFSEYTETQKVTATYFQPRESHRSYLDMLGDYATLDFWHKLLWLPVCCGVQYLIPLPWNGLNDVSMGYTLVYAHQGWVWYLIGGAALYYLLFVSWRDCHRSLLSRYMLWAAACFAGIAWMFGGTVSRYIIPFMPVFVCAALYTVIRYRRAKSFRIFYAVYLIAVAAALTTCYILG